MPSNKVQGWQADTFLVTLHATINESLNTCRLVVTVLLDVVPASPTCWDLGPHQYDNSASGKPNNKVGKSQVSVPLQVAHCKKCQSSLLIDSAKMIAAEHVIP